MELAAQTSLCAAMEHMVSTVVIGLGIMFVVVALATAYVSSKN